LQITALRTESTPGGIRFSARIRGEENDSVEELAFGLARDGAEFAEPAPEAFALVGALAASRSGERRVRIEGKLCPRFRDDVRVALRLLTTWYGNPEPILEATAGFSAREPPSPRAGLFLSGGVDSVSALRANRLSFPPDHPAAFRDAIFVIGYGLQGGRDTRPGLEELRARQRRSSEAIARIAGLRFIAVESRADVLGEDGGFFLRASHSAHLAAIAHLFCRRLSSASIAASYDPSFLAPWGTHPMLDPNYGSSGIEIRHEGFGLTRGERTALVAGWKEALPHLIVCHQAPLGGGRLNCGRCEKCLRTMIDLDLAGALAPPAPFPAEIDRELLEGLRIPAATAPFWTDFPVRLRAGGRGGLAATVQRLLEQSARRERWFEERGWKGTLRRLDRRYLGGRLLAARRKVRPAH
jgi:hypothetical protein